MRSTKAILERYYGFPDWLASLAAPFNVPLCIYVKHVDNTTLYKAVLHAIKSVKGYTRVFPEWSRVAEASWVAMCRRLEKNTMEPKIPTYAHTLLAGAYAIHILYKVQDAVQRLTSILLRDMSSVVALPH